MTTTTKLALELLANSAANQTLANTTFAQLNQLVQAGVVDRLTTPPVSPANEALYIITATATGAWAGKENQLAYWLTSTSAWQYITPREGMLVHVNDEDVYYKYTGSAWAILSTTAADDSITNAKLANMATQTIKGRNTAGTGDPEDLTPSQARTILGLATTDSPTLTALTLINGQIVFPATQVSSADANTLDDYEEGTWTPVLTFATPGDLSITYSEQAGYYTKIGWSVVLEMRVTTSSFTHTTASGNLFITGSPFTTTVAAGGACAWQGISRASYTDAVFVRLTSGNIICQQSGNGVSISTVDFSHVPSGGTVSFRGGLNYHV